MADMEQINIDRMNLREFADLTGSTIRTIRYYIAEGLLPPPKGIGVKACYSTDHLERMQLINRLKALYLPLRTIRKLTMGLNEEEVRQHLALEDGALVALSRDKPAASNMIPIRPKIRVEAAPAAKPLYKTTLVIWTEEDPSRESLHWLACKAENGGMLGRRTTEQFNNPQEYHGMNRKEN